MKGYQVNVEKLNIRSGPGVSFEDIGDVYQDDVLLAPKDWVPIVLTDDSIGWLAKKYITEVEAEEEEASLPGPSKVTGRMIVDKAMTQAGDPYVFGYEVNLNDPNPKKFDCSELVEWVCFQLRISPQMPDGAVYQMKHCQKYGFLISISEAVKTPGALLFRISSSGNHVVISRGDGSTIEAKGSAYGVGVFSSANRPWTHAGLIPGVSYR
jgi:hypothetical protein